MENESLELGPKRRSGPECFWRLLKLHYKQPSIDVTAAPHRRRAASVSSQTVWMQGASTSKSRLLHISHNRWTRVAGKMRSAAAFLANQPKENRIEMFCFRLSTPATALKWWHIKVAHGYHNCTYVHRCIYSPRAIQLAATEVQLGGAFLLLWDEHVVDGVLNADSSSWAGIVLPWVSFLRISILKN